MQRTATYVHAHTASNLAFSSTPYSSLCLYTTETHTHLIVLVDMRMWQQISLVKANV